ncbi:MAG: ABC transporter permease, partial [Peptococcaceae bacterium]|nr:ABC transporter permease [Peptococcaceae bacterium]
MLRQLILIMKREIRHMWRDKSLRLILLTGPLLGLLLFVGVYSHQRVDNIQTAIVDLDKTYASQQIINKLENT